MSNGTIIVRDEGNQEQKVADLSRDVENANGSIGPIFDKEKEQKRLEQVQLIGEIGSQAADIARTEGNIRATDAGKAELAAKGIREPGRGATEEERTAYTSAVAATDSYKAAQQQWGTGSAVQQGIQAATAAVQGLAGGNMAQAISGAAAPYLAEQIHTLTEGNPAAQAMAHAVVGAVVAQASGHSALAGAAGAVTGEVMAQLVIKQLYPGKKVSELSETEKQTIAALGTLAAGIAGGITGDGTADAVAGAQAGKNATENNNLSLPGGLGSYGKAASTLGSSMIQAGATQDEISTALSKNAQGDLPANQNPVTGLLTAWGTGASVVGGTVLLPAAGTAAVLGGGVLGGVTDAVKQATTTYYKPDEHYSYTDTLIAIGTGALTQGKGLLLTESVNISGAFMGSYIKGENATGAVIGMAIGTAVGIKGGDKITDKLAPIVVSPVTAEIGGAVGGSLIGTVVGSGIESGIKSQGEKQ